MILGFSIQGVSMSKVSGLLSITTADILGAGITAVFWFILAALMLPEEYGQIH